MMTNWDERAREIAGPHHVIVEDCWFSCPLSGECCNADAPLECTCGVDAQAAKIATALREAYAAGLEKAEAIAVRCAKERAAQAEAITGKLEGENRAWVYAKQSEAERIAAAIRAAKEGIG